MTADKVRPATGPFWHQQLIGQDTLLEDIITYSDLLFGAEDMPHASALLPPGVALSRAGVISFHPVDDGPQPGSSRTRYKVVDPTEHPTTLVPGGTSASATPLEGAVERSIGDLQGQQPVGMEEPDSAIAAADVNSAPSSPGRSAFTPDEELDLLFDPSFIPKNLRDSLGSDLHVGHQSREKKQTDDRYDHSPRLISCAPTSVFSKSSLTHRLWLPRFIPRCLLILNRAPRHTSSSPSSTRRRIKWSRTVRLSWRKSTSMGVLRQRISRI